MVVVPAAHKSDGERCCYCALAVLRGGAGVTLAGAALH